MGRLLNHIFRKAGNAYSTGRWVFKSLTGSEEEALQAEYGMGRLLAKEILRDVGTEPDSPEQQLVNGIGEKLTGRLTNKKRRFRFMVIESPEINAFALPGGFIFITRSLIELCAESQDELAFVMGHEMGHVVKGHAFDRMLANSALKVVSRLQTGAGMLGQISKQALTSLLSSSYSQEQELEADAFGAGIMDAARFDAQGSVHFMKKMQGQKTTKGNTALSKYFSTHPEYPVRLQNLQKTLQSL